MPEVQQRDHRKIRGSAVLWNLLAGPDGGAVGSRPPDSPRESDFPVVGIGAGVGLTCQAFFRSPRDSLEASRFLGDIVGDRYRIIGLIGKGHGRGLPRR